MGWFSRLLPAKDSAPPPEAKVVPQTVVAGYGANTRRIRLETFLEELHHAGELQRGLMPRTMPDVPGYEIDVLHGSARQLSGDYYDFLPLPDGRMGIVIADASSKGVSAGLIAAMTRALVHAEARDAGDPKAYLTSINGLLTRLLKPGVFVSMGYGLLDPRKNILLLANAGHVQTLVCRPAARQVVVYDAKAPVLGAGGPAVFDMSVQVEDVPLDAGDRVLMITSGAKLALSPDERERGAVLLSRRLTTECDKTCTDFLRGLERELDACLMRGTETDDTTIVAFRRTP